MKAIVCDCCGKTILLENPYCYPSGTYQLHGEKEDLCIDLCEECAAKLTKAIREQEVTDL